MNCSVYRIDSRDGDTMLNDEERHREAIRQLRQAWVEAVHHGHVDRGT